MTVLFRGAPRMVESPLTAEMLKPLDPTDRIVQFKSRLSEPDFVTVGEWLSESPDAELRVFGNHDHSIADLDFLVHFPFLRNFTVEVFDLHSIDGLGSLSELTRLRLGQTRKKLSVAQLTTFPELRKLWLDGPVRDFDSVGMLKNLSHLGFGYMRVDDFRPLHRLHDLTVLTMHHGSVTSLDDLPNLAGLQRISLCMVRGVTDLSILSGATSLRDLELDSLQGVRRLPDFAGLTHLRTLVVENLRSLDDLTPLTTARSLRRLDLLKLRQFGPADVALVDALPELRTALVDLGGVKKNALVRAASVVPSHGFLRSPAWFDEVTGPGADPSVE